MKTSLYQAVFLELQPGIEAIITYAKVHFHSGIITVCVSLLVVAGVVMVILFVILKRKQKLNQGTEHTLKTSL